MQQGYFTLGDKLLVLLALLGLGALAGYLYQPAEEATHLEVFHGSEMVHRVPVKADQQLQIAGLIGDSVIQISNGQARFIDSPCRQKVCVHNGWLDKRGQLAACLPNRVAIRMAASP